MYFFFQLCLDNSSMSELSQTHGLEVHGDQTSFEAREVLGFDTFGFGSWFTER